MSYLSIIAKIREICKVWKERLPKLRRVLLVAILVLSCVLSYGLGYLAGKERGIIRIDSPIVDLTAEEQVVAARGGSVYYLPWCAGAQRIQNQNRVWFPTKEAAEEAGYSSAKNCDGI